MVYSEFISDINTLNVDNIVFSKPKEVIQGSKRIRVYVMDGETKSPLYIQMGDTYCFGISPSKLPKEDKITGYQMALPLWGQEGSVSDEQKVFLDTFEKIVQKCISHLMLADTRKAIRKLGLVKESLVTFSPIWRRRDPETGAFDETKSPVLYAKLLTAGENLEIETEFSEPDGTRVDPYTFLEKGFRTSKVLLMVHSIFIGTTIKLQVRVVEVEVEQRAKKRSSLMLKPPPKKVEEVKQEEEPEEGEEEGEEEKEEEYALDKFSAPAPIEEPVEPEPVVLKPRTSRRKL
jgi:hypothetical protein